MEKAKAKRRKPKSEFGERLEVLVRKRQLRYRDLAAMAGVSVSVISSWIGADGALPSDMAKVKRLADGLKVDFAWLILGDLAGGGQSPESGVAATLERPKPAEYWFIEARKLRPKCG